jgi:hypothetical protein
MRVLVVGIPDIAEEDYFEPDSVQVETVPPAECVR